MLEDFDGTTYYGNWTKTGVDGTVSVPCKTGTGTVTAKCGKFGEWEITEVACVKGGILCPPAVGYPVTYAGQVRLSNKHLGTSMQLWSNFLSHVRMLPLLVTTVSVALKPRNAIWTAPGPIPICAVAPKLVAPRSTSFLQQTLVKPLLALALCSTVAIKLLHATVRGSGPTSITRLAFLR